MCIRDRDNLTSIIPSKSKKIKKRTRFFHFFVIIDKKKNVIIEQRIAKDIWQGLYQFPLIELKEKEKIEDYSNKINSQKIEPKSISKTYKQLLTHQKIISTYHIYSGQNSLEIRTENQQLVHLTELKLYAWPKSINSFLEDQNWL